MTESAQPSTEALKTTDTVTIARFGHEDQFFEIPLRETVRRTTLVDIFGGRADEPIWVFYQNEICGYMVLEESFFIPEKAGTYLVAREEDLRARPYSVEAFKSGIVSFQYVGFLLEKRLIEKILRKMNMDTCNKMVRTCKMLYKITMKEKLRRWYLRET